MSSPARSRPQLVETHEVRTPALEDGLSELVENARLLARHAVEAGRLPEAVDIERVYKIKKRFAEAQAIAEDDFGFLVKTYQLLERRLAPVSADTLRATEWSAEMPCAASKYVAGLVHRELRAAGTFWRRIASFHGRALLPPRSGRAQRSANTTSSKHTSVGVLTRHSRAKPARSSERSATIGSRNACSDAVSFNGETAAVAYGATW